MTLAILTSCLLAFSTANLFPVDGPTVVVTFDELVDLPTDYPGLPATFTTDLAALGTATLAGLDQPGCVEIEVQAPAYRNSASMPCRPGPDGEGAEYPNNDKGKIKINPSKILDLYEVGGSPSDILGSAEGRAAVEATLHHESAHMCLAIMGNRCTDPSGVGYICEELAADAYARDKMCEKTDELCMELCEAIEDADEPPTDEQQAAIDKLGEDLDAACKAVKHLRDKNNKEHVAEGHCIIKALLGDPCAGVVDDVPGCEEVSMPDIPAPPPGGGDGLFDPDGPDQPRPEGPINPDACDYPDSPPADAPEIIKNCEHCNDDGTGDCDCDEDEDEEPGVPPGGGGVIPTGMVAQGQFNAAQSQYTLSIIPSTQTNFFGTHQGSLVVARVESIVPSGPNYVASEALTFGFQPTQISFRDSQSMYALGYSLRAKKWFLEQFSFPNPIGGIVATRDAVDSPIGTPCPTSPLNQYVEGDIFIPPSERVATPPRRAIIWSAELDGLNPKAMSVDDEGRYLIIYSHVPGSSAVLKRVCPGSESDTGILADSSSIGNLHLVDEMYLRNSSTMGRVLVLSFLSESGSAFTLLIDEENDGEFETTLPLSYEEFISSSVLGTFE